MMIRFSGWTCLSSIGLAVALGSGTACGPTARTDCNDGVDNDGDGFVDALDPGCSVNDGLEAPDPVECGDGFDNDGDGLIDGDDYGCEGADDPDEEDPFRQCNDGADNDGDMIVDFPDDPGCDSPVDDDEFNPAECQDGVDNDGDIRIDYPNDPGCIAPEDDDETTPDPLPACADGMDNDSDELTDYPADPGCNSAADEDEFNVIAGACGPILEITDISPTGEATGTIDGPLPNELSSPECNGFGGEFAYTYSVIGGGKALKISTDHPETTLDTVVYIRTECRNPDTELGCDDDGGVLGTGAASTLIIPDAAAGTYYVIVDAFGPGSQGTFKLTVTEHAGLGSACDPTDENPCIDGLICREFTPGAGFTCEHHECEDLFDNDGDTLIDYPDEPGCATPIDDDETDPVPAPECGNGVDDDGDTFIDYPDDPGCKFAADLAEIDECITGVEVDSHPGGTISDTTVGATVLMTAPAGCGFNTNLAPERVYIFSNTRMLDRLVFDTVGSALDTVLYIREGDCAVPGTAAECNDNATGTSSRVIIDSPAMDAYFAIVDGKVSGGGAFNLTVSGTVSPGGSCDPTDTFFVCGFGYKCAIDTCVPTECNDGVDNGDPEDTLADDFDPGCDNINDDDESDPASPPECADGIDNDSDTFTDYPADPDCINAADDKEEQTPFLAADGKSGTLGNLYEVDPATGATTIIGAIGFPVTGLAICPDGTVYGAQGGRATVKDLIEIDPDTAAGTVIGPTGLTNGMPDITCLPDGRLLGWTESGDRPVEFNRTTGAATPFGTSIGSAGSGFASDDTGTIYFLPFGCGSTALYTIDATTGTSTAGPSPSGCTNATINSMTWFEGQLYAVDANRTTGTAAQLGTINVTTGVFTPIGPLPNNVDSIAATF